MAGSDHEVSSSGQRMVNGIIIPGPSGILDRLERVECDRAALPVYAVRPCHARLLIPHEER
jgi:hypothetical protein